MASLELIDVIRELLSSGVEPGPDRPIDAAFLRGRRRALAERLRRAEASGDSHEWIQEKHREWLSFPGRLEDACRDAVALLEARFGVADPAHVDAVLAALTLRTTIEVPSLVDKLELESVVDDLDDLQDTILSAGAWRYLHEAHLLSPAGATPAGRVFLELRGVAALRWLLACELSASTGEGDQWRFSAELAHYLLAHPAMQLGTRVGDTLRVPRAVSKPVLLRLHGLHLLRYGEQGEILAEEVYNDELHGWELTPLGTELLTSLLATPEDPMRMLARALIGDTANVPVLTRLGLPPSESRGVIEFSRALTHELRNVLVPLRTAIEALLSESNGLPPERRAQLERRIHLSIGRLSELGSGSVLSATLGGAPEEVELRALIEEAIASTLAERNGRVRCENRLTGERIRAPRAPLVLAFINLIRNASQARPDRAVLVTFEAIREATGLHVLVGDDGPGVPPDAAEQIFERGVSLRGGTGEGLHQVRSVLRSLGGDARYVTRPTGALFDLHFPEGHR